MTVPGGRATAQRSGMPGPGGAEALLLRDYPGGAQLRLSPPWGVLRLQGEIDIATAPGFRQAVQDLAATGAKEPGLLREILVDLRSVTFLDSAGLAVLARLVRDRPGQGWTVRLVGPRPAVRTALRITGLLEFLPEQAGGELPPQAVRVLG